MNVTMRVQPNGMVKMFINGAYNHIYFFNKSDVPVWENLGYKVVYA